MTLRYGIRYVSLLVVGDSVYDTRQHLRGMHMVGNKISASIQYTQCTSELVAHHAAIVITLDRYTFSTSRKLV